MTSDIDVLDAKLETVKEEGVRAKTRLDKLNRLKDIAFESNLTDVAVELGHKIFDAEKQYELLKDNYRLIRERRDSFPV
jgi:hypothetical protein